MTNREEHAGFLVTGTIALLAAAGCAGMLLEQAARLAF